MYVRCSLIALTLSVAVPLVETRAATINGTVTFEGTAPTMRIIEMDSDPVCASKHKEPVRDEVLVLGEGQTMANIVIQIIEGLPAQTFEIPKDPAVLTQEGCRYSPHVLIVRKGQSLKVLNPDGTLHNVHGLSKTNPEFNKSMPASMTETAFVFEKTEEPFPLKCQVHPWMTAYVAVIDHPFAVVTGTDGKFSLEGLSPGTYTVQAWHERLGAKTAQVTVTDDSPATADFTFAR